MVVLLSLIPFLGVAQILFLLFKSLISLCFVAEKIEEKSNGNQDFECFGVEKERKLSLNLSSLWV